MAGRRKENVCDIPGDECGNQGWVQVDKNCDGGSHDRCGEKVSAIGDEDMDDEREEQFGKREQSRSRHRVRWWQQTLIRRARQSCWIGRNFWPAVGRI
jgi:hypothetical protein